MLCWGGVGPPVMSRPILPPDSVDHRLPSGPGAIPLGSLTGVGIWNSVILPPVLIRPILLPSLDWVNQRLPSRPPTMKKGLPAPAIGNSVIVPVVLIRPILSPS